MPTARPFATFATFCFNLSLCVSLSSAAAPLRWKFQPSLTNRYETTQDTTITKTGAGGEFTQKSNMTMNMSWTVEKVKDDGSAVLKQKIDRMRMKISLGDGQASEIDSAAKADPQGQAAIMAPFLKVMTEHPFTVTMTPRGEVKDVELPKEIAEALKSQPGAPQMGDLATTDGFKKLVAAASFVLPEKLEENATWTQKTEASLPQVGTQTAVTTYRYVGPQEKDGKTLEKFTAQITLKYSGGQIQVEVPKQDSKGEIFFNRTDGRLESSNIKQTTQLRFALGNQSIDQTIEQTIGMKWLPEKKE
jgi:hypothetical protein